MHCATWQHGPYSEAGACLVLHGGCDVNRVVETQAAPYSSRKYGRWSNSRTFLFYTNCVALLSRAKGFNDTPNGFAEGFRRYDRGQHEGMDLCPLAESYAECSFRVSGWASKVHWRALLGAVESCRQERPRFHAPCPMP